MKKITVAVLAALIIAAAISALSIVSYKAVTSDSAPTAQPDRVIAVLLKCQRPLRAGTLTDPQFGGIADLNGSECTQANSVNIINARLSLTVRTSEGSTYQIDVPTTTSVKVGDTWPKK